MIVSIHQPNYIPWLGFFHKVLLSDIYVVFDDVQFPRGKDYANRNQIKTNNGQLWLTIPISGKGDLKLWNQMTISNHEWVDKHLMNIKSFYKKSKYFNLYYEDLELIYKKNHSHICDLNVDLIRYFLSCLECNTKIVFSSDLKVQSTGLDKIVHILELLHATKYISGSGNGSTRYIDENVFKQKNIELIWQQYKHPIYKQQFGDFIPYMSIIDLLFNHGPDSRNIILS